MTCGYENYVLSGRRDIDRCVTGVIEIVLCVCFVRYNSASKKDLADMEVILQLKYKNVFLYVY
jgi:hypothetical protein